MTKAATVSATILLAVVTLAAQLAAQGADDEEMLSTLAVTAQVRDDAIPPLTLAGVYRAWYTPLKWVFTRKVFEAIGEELPPEVGERGDRVAVACAVWESPSGDEWVREFQGLWRGQNNLVGGLRYRLPPDVLGDLHHMQHCTAEAMTEIDCSYGYPLVTVRPARAHRGWQHLANSLGLELVSSELAVTPGEGPIGGGEWRLAPIEQEDGVFTVRIGYYDVNGDETIETLFTLEEAFGFAPTWYRRVAFRGARGHAYEALWSDFVDLGDDGPHLPTSWVRWEFEYGYDAPTPLLQTKSVTCVDLRPTPDGETPPLLPMCAALDRTNSDPELAGTAGDRLYGAALRAACGQFATEVPPEPPGDLLALDTSAAREEIKERYGF